MIQYPLNNINILNQIELKMKIFQQVKANLASLGHRPNQSPFNKKQLWIFVKVLLYLILLCAYLVREPSTPKEYMNSIFITTAAFLVSIARLSTLFLNETIFDFIGMTEETINGSQLYSYVFN